MVHEYPVFYMYAMRCDVKVSFLLVSFARNLTPVPLSEVAYCSVCSEMGSFYPPTITFDLATMSSLSGITLIVVIHSASPDTAAQNPVDVLTSRVGTFTSHN